MGGSDRGRKGGLNGLLNMGEWVGGWVGARVDVPSLGLLNELVPEDNVQTTGERTSRNLIGVFLHADALWVGGRVG